jgi:putative ABC transport system permease protein
MGLAVRTSSDPLRLAAAVASAVHELDKNQSVAHIQTLNQVVGASLAQPRFNSLLLAAFAALALLLAAVGIYGVISYSVAIRTREIGIRMALGATPADVLRLVVGYGMGLALAGAAIGLAGALIVARLMSSLLYGVKPSDAPSLLAAFAVLVSVALLACYIPGRRATAVDPMVTLRQE